jgi:hypothetical protein
MVLGKKPVQVCEFFVGHGRISHNAEIYRNLLILPRFRRAPVPVSFTAPGGAGPACRAQLEQAFGPFGGEIGMVGASAAP